MLRTILIAILISLSLSGYAQETIADYNKLSPGVTEEFHVLKSDHKIKNGPYKAFYNKKILIASGNYSNNKRTGVWYFYNSMGHEIQQYDFDQKKLISGTVHELTEDFLSYEFLPKVNDSDSVIFPIKVGGLFYGYLNYVNKFKVKTDAENSENTRQHGVLQMLVSPGGRLAECTLLIKGRVLINYRPQTATIDKYQLDPELLSEDDKLFIPAKVNGVNVAVTIYIYCYIKSNGKIQINN
jgi:hypothetical protein